MALPFDWHLHYLFRTYDPEMRVMLHPLFCLCVTHLLSHLLPIMCTTSPLFLSTRLSQTYPLISILSCYVPIMPCHWHLPIPYRLSHMYISFYLALTYNSPPLYYLCIIISFLHVSDTSHTDVLPYCAPMCLFPEHLHVYFIYDMSLYLTCISSTLVKT